MSSEIEKMPRSAQWERPAKKRNRKNIVSVRRKNEKKGEKDDGMKYIRRF